MKKIYVVTVIENEDYVACFDNVDMLADYIVAEYEEEDIFLEKEDVKKHIENRRKENYISLLYIEDIDNDYNEEDNIFNVRVCKLNNK